MSGFIRLFSIQSRIKFWCKRIFGPIEKWEFPIPVYLNYRKAKNALIQELKLYALKKSKNYV